VYLYRRSRSVLVLACVTLVLLALAGCADTLPTPDPPGGPAAAPPSHEELARHYAPVIHQGTATDQDFITAVDFDGDWISNNNWQNQPGGDLSAHVYYSVAETDSHWFLFYALFHPRDYTDEPCEESDGCHENDMESIQMVVRKDGTAHGQLQAVETLAHSDIHLYRADDSVGKNALKVEVDVRLEEGHPEVYVETYGHGIYAKRIILVPHVVTYRVGDEAQVPEGLADEDVAYRLVPIYDSRSRDAASAPRRDRPRPGFRSTLRLPGPDVGRQL